MEMTDKGIRTSDGKEHELDVIIFATGCDLKYLLLTWGSFGVKGKAVPE
jgi:cation diffusion facilitator CzcD-associated flavoprotein CzcO